MVSLSAALSGRSGKTSCTLPLPNVVSPTMTARSWFFSAPATISLALARRAVHEQRDRVVRLGAVGVRDLLLAPLARVADGGDDGAVGEELVGDARRLIEQAAGVAAQIEDEALELAVLLADRRARRRARSTVFAWNCLRRT